MIRKGIASYCERIHILTRSVSSPDTFGEEIESWSEPGSGVWARRDDRSGSETVLFGGVRRTAESVVFAVPGRPGVKPVDRVRGKYTNELFLVDAVQYDRNRNETLILCSLPAG